MQSSPDSSSAPRWQALSSLMDGDLPAGELSGVIAEFRHVVDVRERWHAYHMIADVLRTEELATAPMRDERMLQALRLRLSREPTPQPAPIVLAAAAPQPERPPSEPSDSALAPVGRRRSAGWLLAPAAVVAGFAAVAAALLVGKVTVAPPAAEAVIAKNEPAPGRLLRDARLDTYLAAHRSLGTGLGGAAGAERTVQIVYEPK